MNPTFGMAGRIIPALAAACCLCAQTPPGGAEAHGLPARTAPSDYQAQVKVGGVTLAADFTGHGIPNEGEALSSEDYVAVEVALYGAADARLTISMNDFSLRINGQKTPLASQPWGLVAKGIRDPHWAPPEAEGESKSKGGGLSAGGSGQQAGQPPPLPPKPPIELLRSWQIRLRKAAIAEGDRALPQAGLIFFQTRTKADKIKTVELLYEGPAGKAAVALQ